MIGRIEKELGRELDIALKHSVPSLNEIAPEMLAELKRLPRHMVNMYLKFHLPEGHETAFEDFTRDVIRGDAEPRTWGYRDVLALVEDRRGEALTMTADQVRAALAEVEGERWVCYSVDNARLVNQAASSGAWGAPGVLVRHKPYWWSPPGKGVSDHTVSSATVAVPEEGFRVAVRRWIAFRTAWSAKFKNVDFAAASPREIVEAIGVTMDRVSADGAIALAALIREAQLPFDPDKHVRGYVGPDEWYAGDGGSEGSVSKATRTPLTGQAALDLHERLRERDERDRAEALVAARKAADERGKEPFDLETLERMVDTSTPDGNLAAVDVRRARLEYQYYVSNPRLNTLAGFAQLLQELKQW